MDALASFGKTALVLVGLWAILAVIALAAGVVPGFGAHETAAGDDAGVEVADGGVDDAGGVSDAAPLADAGAEAAPAPTPAAPAASPPASPALPRARVCAEPTLAPSLAVVDVIGDARPEIVVGCGAAWEIVGRSTDGALMRVAEVRVPEGLGDRSPLTSAAVAIDVDQDGDTDGAFPFARVGAGGATSGGGLFVLPRAASGAWSDPRSLAPIAAVAIAPITLPQGAGLVALDRANPFARAPSEAWIMGLGAAPARVAAPHAGTGATGLGVVDVDRDGRLDVLVASSDDSRLDVLYGDASARFSRSRTLSVPSVADVIVGDLDGDGAPDALLAGAGVSRLLSRSGEDASVAPIEGAPTLRDATLADVDGDGRMDVVGWSHPALVVLGARADGTYESRTLFELEGGEIGPRRVALADVDGDGAREAVLLVVGDHAGARTLDLVVVPSAERGRVRTEEAHPLPDAPLSLTLQLPDPNAP